MSRPRTKIRSYDVMPAILESLKAQERLKTKAINEQMRSVALAKELKYRQLAVGYALIALEWKGWVSHEAHGIWAITQRGLECPVLTEAQAIEIGMEWEAHHESATSAPRALFARVGWMKYYNGPRLDDQQAKQTT
jgi:hypothetical protein